MYSRRGCYMQAPTWDISGDHLGARHQIILGLDILSGLFGLRRRGLEKSGMVRN